MKSLDVKLKMFFCFICLVSWVGVNSAGGRHQNPAISELTDDHRKAIVHRESFVIATSSQFHHRRDPCYFKRCYPGQKCVVDGITRKATCVCRNHCRNVKKPVCGSDGNYYVNKCEMHKAACETGNDVYDARHKDCFYKESVCNSANFSAFLDFLTQYHQSASRMRRHEDAEWLFAPETDETKYNDDVITDETSSELNDLLDNVITNSMKGETVMSMFRVIDLDADGEVGSEEIYEASLLDDFDSVFPPPCSLYHVLHYADGNHDNSMDIHELLRIYNVTELLLTENKRLVEAKAEYGKSVTLECAIQGEPKPLWLRHGYNVAIHGGRGVKVDERTLRISNVRSIHSGNYSCQARKIRRSQLSQTFTLIVMTKPHVQVYPKTQHRQIGSSITIKCHVTGIPMPHIKWFVDGEELDNESKGYLMMENKTELHINNAVASHSGGYSCLAANEAGSFEEIATVFVSHNVKEDGVADSSQSGSYFAFNDGGINIIEASACQVLRSFEATETVPGLLKQDKLCMKTRTGGDRRCEWSAAVAVGSRLVYAAQPKENRIIVLDRVIQRIVEVITTDPIPSSLTYVTSTDQVFVHCWFESSRLRSTLQVIHAAGVPGSHSAAQIQPLHSGSLVDLSVLEFFVPPEGATNIRSDYGYVAHSNEQFIYKLNLSTLTYEDRAIDLRPHNCIPNRFAFQPIGGRLHVTCQGNFPVSLTIEVASNRVITLVEKANFSREYVSRDSRHVIRVFPRDQAIKIFNVSESGVLIEKVVLHTNMEVDDVAIAQKLSAVGGVSVFISTRLQGNVLQVDPSTGSVLVIGGLPQHIDQSKTAKRTLKRPLVPSSCFSGYIATSGDSQFNIIDVSTNEVVCRLDDITKASAIVWSDVDPSFV